MAKLRISHHEQVEGQRNRWHVFLQGRSEAVPVELPEEERRSLELSDEEIHELLPSALERHAEENPDAAPAGAEYRDVTWDAPVRVMQTHFIA
jgi:hypothetical protein